jgi:hypothetical protein
MTYSKMISFDFLFIIDYYCSERSISQCDDNATHVTVVFQSSLSFSCGQTNTTHTQTFSLSLSLSPCRCWCMYVSMIRLLRELLQRQQFLFYFRYLTMTLKQATISVRYSIDIRRILSMNGK